MQNRTYADLLDRIEALGGKDAYTSAEQTRLLSLVNARLYNAYRQCEYWPRYLTCEERYVGFKTITVSGAGTATSDGVYTLSTGDDGAPNYVLAPSNEIALEGGIWELFDGGITYETEDDDVTGTWIVGASGSAPVPTFTAERPIIPYEVAGATSIDTVLRIHADNPFNTNSVAEYNFFGDVDGALIIGPYDLGETVWVTYKKRWAGPYAAAATDIPVEFFEYAAHGAYADFLRSDGQNLPIAQAEDAAASQMLMLELNQAMQRYNAQNTSRRFSTYISNQAR